MVDAGLCLKETIKRNHLNLVKENSLEFIDKELTFKIYKSVEDCLEYWPCIRCEDPFFSPEYFKILEQRTMNAVKPLYCFVFIKNDVEPISMYFMQKKKLRLTDNINIEKFKEGTGTWAGVKNFLQRIFFPFVNFDLMVVGNVLLTGKYGFRGSDGTVQLKDYQILNRLLKNLRCKVRKTPYEFNGALIKDFFPNEKLSQKRGIRFAEIQFDPSMVLHIRPDWRNMDDYLLDMKSKHRVRIKKHLKQSSDLTIRLLNNKEVSDHEEEIFVLYDAVVRASGFNMATADRGYFTKLSDKFPNQFFVNGIFLKGSLVGFYSYMLKDGVMMSHFIGYDEKNNKEFAIYFNILLGLIRNAIETKVEKLYYYRTALEIKSSVGAVPHDMYCYLTHMNPLLNSLVGVAIKTFFPVPKWTPRNPFKLTDSSVHST